jgi:superfamily II DNA or RNA helicase
MRIVVDNRVRVPAGGLDPRIEEDVRSDFCHRNPARAVKERFGIPGWWSEPRFEETWKHVKFRSGERWLTLPRGGLGRVLSRLGAPVEADFRTSRGAADLSGLIPEHRVELREYQLEALEAAVAAKVGIVRAPTGSGKTTIAIGLVSRINLPALVLVNTTELLEQWRRRAQVELGLKPREVGVVRGSERSLRPLTVAMQQSLHRQGFDDEFAATWGVVLYDEVQMASASSYYAVVDRFPAEYRIGISADNRRKDGKEYLNEDLFGEVVYEVEREVLERGGHVLDVSVKVLPTEFRADWYGMGEDEDGEERELDFNRLSDEMMLDGDRNDVGIEAAALAAHEGKKVFVMTRRREHCQRVAAGLTALGVRAGFMIGGADYRKEFVQTAEDLRSGKKSVGVGTVQSIGVGIDFPAVGTAVVMTPIAGNRQLTNQVRGRVCRPFRDKEAELIYLWDRHCSYARPHLKNLVAHNRVSVLVADNWVDGRAFLKTL